MRHKVIATLLLIIFLGVPTRAAPARQAAVPHTPLPVDIVQVARTTVEQVDRREYANVIASFSVKLAAALPEAKLRTTWERYQSRVGRLRTIGEPKMNPRGDLRGVRLPAQFDKGERTIEVVFNTDGQIAGLLFR